MLGPDQPVILHMLDIAPAAEALNGVKMELVDATFPLLNGVVATTDAVEACTRVNVAVIVGGFPRKEGMERKDVMLKDFSIYKVQASALEKHAAANYKAGSDIGGMLSAIHGFNTGITLHQNHFRPSEKCLILFMNGL